jgi:hypothetical protein
MEWPAGSTRSWLGHTNDLLHTPACTTPPRLANAAFVSAYMLAHVHAHAAAFLSQSAMIHRLSPEANYATPANTAAYGI